MNGDFAGLHDELENYLSERKDYRPTKHVLDAEHREGIERRWSAYLNRYGYAGEGSSPAVLP